MKQTAKLFINGRSQAVRLPAEYRFDGDEVFVRRDPATGDVILSRKPTNWDSFIEALKDTDVPDDFLDAKDRDQGNHRKDPFEGWDE
jgi:antitoxin VapB